MCQTYGYFVFGFERFEPLFKGNQNPAEIKDFQYAYADDIMGTDKYGPQAPTLITSCGEDGSFMSVTPAADMRKLVQRYRDLGTKVTYVPAKCDDTELITNTYRWTTDLFGMQTIDWIDAKLKMGSHPRRRSPATPIRPPTPRGTGLPGPRTGPRAQALRGAALPVASRPVHQGIRDRPGHLGPRHDTGPVQAQYDQVVQLLPELPAASRRAAVGRYGRSGRRRLRLGHRGSGARQVHLRASRHRAALPHHHLQRRTALRNRRAEGPAVRPARSGDPRRQDHPERPRLVRAQGPRDAEGHLPGHDDPAPHLRAHRTDGHPRDARRGDHRRPDHDRVGRTWPPATRLASRAATPTCSAANRNTASAPCGTSAAVTRTASARR